MPTAVSSAQEQEKENDKEQEQERAVKRDAQGEEDTETDSDSDSGSSSSGSDSDDSDSDEEDGLSAEQRAKIQERMAALRANFQKYTVTQEAGKVKDLCNAVTNLTEQQALVALELCNNNELEAAERIELEEGFRNTVEAMAEARMRPRRAARASSRTSGATSRSPSKVQVQIREGGVARRSRSGKGPSEKMPNAVSIYDVADELSEEAIRTHFCQFGSIQKLVMQRPRKRAIVCYEKYESVNKALQGGGNIVIAGIAVRIKEKVKKQSRVGRILLDDALLMLQQMEKNSKAGNGQQGKETEKKKQGKQQQQSSPPSLSAAAPASASPAGGARKSSAAKNTPLARSKKRSRPSGGELAEGDRVEVRTRASESDPLQWFPATVLRRDGSQAVTVRYDDEDDEGEYELHLEKDEWRRLAQSPGGRRRRSSRSAAAAASAAIAEASRLRPSPKKSPAVTAKVRTTASATKTEPQKARTASASASSTGSAGAKTSRSRKKSTVSMGECLRTELGQKLLAMGWSEARVKAYCNRENNPNAYYYRFNDPGETQAKGKFTQEEKVKFKSLVKNGVDYRWGLFSQSFPGRVGYQCSNFYRQLLATGEIVDPNYVVDEATGKLTFKRTGKKTGTSKVSIGKARPAPQRKPRAPAAKRARKPAAKRKAAPRKRKAAPKPKRRRPMGPELLPGFRDPMTNEKCDELAISPFGHIMSYASWLRALQPSFDEESETYVKKQTNTCPFTQQRLTRRMLVKLTAENIDEYREKILNFDATKKTV